LIRLRIKRPRTLETDLYPPIKRHLERLGLEVKGEVCGCDLVALSDGSPELVVIGEMKQSFTLELVLQAVDRTSACDEVWLAVGASKRGRGRESSVDSWASVFSPSPPRDGSTWWRSQRHGSRDATPNGVRASSRSTVAARGHRVIDASAVSLRFAAASLSRDTLCSGLFTVGRVLATRKSPTRTSTGGAT
jgi:hypothetical protein